MTVSRRPKVSSGATDWARIDALREDEIEAMAKADADNPATTYDDWAKAAVHVPAKTPVNAKFDEDVVNWFKSQGRGYQARMNAVLRRYMDAQRKVG